MKLKLNITKHSKLSDLEKHVPQFFHFLNTLAVGKKKQTLESFCREQALPPAEILYAQWQLQMHTKNIAFLSPRELLQKLQTGSDLKLIDVREAWELDHAKIEKSVWLDEDKMQEFISSEDKNRPLVLFCHFGVRSLDFAAILARNGFSNVTVISGGIDAWALEVDSNIERYSEGWC